MLLDIKFAIVFNRIGHVENMFLRRRRSPLLLEFWFVFSCSFGARYGSICYYCITEQELFDVGLMGFQ